MIEVSSATQVGSLTICSIFHCYVNVHFCYSDCLHIAVEPSLKLLFINSSPRVSGDTVIADFTINRPTVSVVCRLTGQPETECKFKG